MSAPIHITFEAAKPETLKQAQGRLVVFAHKDHKLSALGHDVDKAIGGALVRALGSERFAELKEGEALDLAFPAGLAAQAVQLICLSKRPTQEDARKAGGAIGKALGAGGALIVADGGQHLCEEIAFGITMRAYSFTAHKSKKDVTLGPVRMMVDDPESCAVAAAAGAAVAEGVFLCRDLVNEPANVLTTSDFAARLCTLQEIGLEVEVLEEEALEALGMGALLGVGQGSRSPSKVVVMQWRGGAQGAAPFALVGKGVVFDTGGISIKPAGGMEEMTMDMGGAATVAGVMRTLALRKAPANVVGLVGLVENMPDGNAQRPGDVVRSMKGDTIEVINTDAEGRLVLADVMWYAQERFAPAAMVDLATLTGAVIVALGHENTGVFSNDDTFCGALLHAAKAEGEGAWHLPMGAAYDAKLKSRIADMMNVGGRDGGAITAAQFLGRFVKDNLPWCHLDIAGTALLKSESALAPKGATGWGVMTLNRLIRERFETP